MGGLGLDGLCIEGHSISVCFKNSTLLFNLCLEYREIVLIFSYFFVLVN